MNRANAGGRLTCWLGRLVCLLGLVAGGGAGAVEQVVYYHTDALGSPVAGTDAEGRVLWRESYLPYGERRTYESREQHCGAGYCRPVESQADEKVWYTGKFEEPGVGLVYLGARWYDPELGRFLSPDPAGYDPEVYESFSAYAYGNNNPYRYVDPSGEVAETVWDVASIAVGVWSLGGNVLDGNWRAAGVDAVGLAVDGAAAVIPFVPGGAGMAIRAGREAGEAAADIAKVAKGETTVIGRVKDLQNLKQGEKSLLDRLPDQGSPKANWKQNSGVLRQEMARGQSIRDASPGDKRGQFLNAERNLLEDRGWKFDEKTNFWNPPAQ